MLVQADQMQHRYHYCSRVINMAQVKSLGFTLIEMIMVITISGIIVAGSGLLLMQGVKAYMTGKNDINTSWQASMAIERMTRDLHTASSITTATGSEFAIKDIYGNIINYKTVGNQLLWNTQVLASNVQSIAFTYYDANGISTATTSAMRYVGISLNIIYAATTSNFSTRVALWNIK